jgi:hypothetical protein
MRANSGSVAGVNVVRAQKYPERFTERRTDGKL